MKKWWIFKNQLNFTIFIGSSSALGLLYYNYLTEQKLDDPVVHFSVKKLGQNDMILQITGYPVQFYSSFRQKNIANVIFRNRVFRDRKVFHANYTAKGPRGSVKVELHANAVSFQEIQLQKIEENVVPQAKVLLQIRDKKIKNPEELLQPVDKNDMFWNVTNLTAEIGDQNHQMVIIPDLKQMEKQKQKLIKLKDDLQQNGEEVFEEKTINYQNIYDDFEKDSKNDRQDGISDIEKEELRKFRQQQFYNQIRGARMFQAAVFLFGGMVAYQYIKRNKRIPINNTELHHSILKNVRSHPQIMQFFKEEISTESSLICRPLLEGLKQMKYSNLNRISFLRGDLRQFMPKAARTPNKIGRQRCQKQRRDNRVRWSKKSRQFDFIILKMSIL